MRKTNTDARIAMLGGFTMVELMVVMGLIGLVMLFAVPAFRDLGRGGGARSAAFQLNTTFSLARQNAISTRARTYVVFPDDDPALYTNPITHREFAELGLRAYRVYSERDGYITDWRRLPPGLIFDPEFERGSTTANAFQALTGTGLRYVENLPFASSDGPTRNIIAVGFRSDGPVHKAGGTAAWIFIRPGWTTHTPNADPAFREWGAEENSTTFAVRLNGVTGQSSIREIDP